MTFSGFASTAALNLFQTSRSVTTVEFHQSRDHVGPLCAGAELPGDLQGARSALEVSLHGRCQCFALLL